MGGAASSTAPRSTSRQRATYAGGRVGNVQAHFVGLADPLPPRAMTSSGSYTTGMGGSVRGFPASPVTAPRGGRRVSTDGERQYDAAGVDSPSFTSKALRVSVRSEPSGGSDNGHLRDKSEFTVTPTRHEARSVLARKRMSQSRGLLPTEAPVLPVDGPKTPCPVMCDVAVATPPADIAWYIKNLLEMAKDRRVKTGKFKKDERILLMELYDVMGLDMDEFMTKPNELQLTLKEYCFPPPNMSALRDMKYADKATIRRMIGAKESEKRAQQGMVPEEDERPINSGDLLREQLRRHAVSSEVYNADADQSARVWVEYTKTGKELDRLAKVTEENLLFKPLDSRDRNTLFLALQQERFAPGAVIIEQGEYGNSYYIIDSGKCQISIRQNEDAEEKVVGTLDSGEAFGELGLMYGTARAATITAITDVICWALDRDTYRGILLNVTYQKRQRYMAFLDTVNIFQSLGPYEKARIADMLAPSELPPDTVIVQEEESGDTFYLIEDGEVEVSSRKQGKICKLSSGMYFGELALLYSQPRKATVTTIRQTHLVSLNRKAFQNYLGGLQELFKRNEFGYEEPKEGSKSLSLNLLAGVDLISGSATSPDPDSAAKKTQSPTIKDIQPTSPAKPMPNHPGTSSSPHPHDAQLAHWQRQSSTNMEGRAVALEGVLENYDPDNFTLPSEQLSVASDEEAAKEI